MAPDAQTEEEPSIEEILDSIRQIISDEDDAEETAESDLDLSAKEDTSEDFSALVEAAADADENESPDEEALFQDNVHDESNEPAEEIIDLTQKIENPKPDPEPEPIAAEPDNAQETVEDDTMTDEPVSEMDALLKEDPDDAEIQIGMEDADSESEPAVDVPAATPSITDAEIAAAASDDGDILTNGAAEAALGAISALAQKAAVERAGSVTIEDIVREEMRPILRVWLDKNLPEIIERLMKKELSRIAKDVQG